MMLRPVCAMGLCVVLASPLLAQTVTGKEAGKALFAPVKAEVEILPAANLPKDQAAALKMVGAGQPYYGAIAISPKDGLMSEATVAAANYHSTDAASAAALAECDAKRKGKEPCVVAALIRPKGWKDKGVQLSSDATAGFRKSYDAAAGTALAISPLTGGWGIGAGAKDAIDACIARTPKAKASKASDCKVLIEN